MGQNLYELIEQLTGSAPSGKRLRRQFHDNPESVTKDLSPDARRALYTMDQNQGGEITKQVKAEFEAEGRGDEYSDWETWFLEWKFPRKEFVKRSELPPDCQWEGQLYPNPQPLVYDIAPRAVFLSQGPTVEVNVSGQGFVTGRTRLALRKQGTNTALVVAPKYSGIEGSFRCGHLYADVTLPQGPLGAAEMYDIRIILTTGTDTNGNPVEWGPLPVRLDQGQRVVFKINP